MISVRSLSFRYPNVERDVLSDISMDFIKGSFTAIMGANGSGKSTLARCLNGLLPPTSGEVVVDGLNTKDSPSLPAIRQSVGFVFQDPNLQMTSATVERELAFGLQNLGMSQSEIHRKVEHALEQLGGQRNAPPSALSGGEQQRLALAAVMVLEPKYLVLDEPTAFLSPTSRMHIMENLLRARREKGVTLILVTQCFTEALHAGRLIILKDSCIGFDGAPSAMVSHRGELASFGIYTPHAFGFPP